MYCSHCWYLAEFRDTWTFVNRRIKDALDLQKTFQEVPYLSSNCITTFMSYFTMFFFWRIVSPYFAVPALVTSTVLTCQTETIFPQAAYLAEAVGAGMGGTVQGVLNRVFQNRGGWTFSFLKHIFPFINWRMFIIKQNGDVVEMHHIRVESGDVFGWCCWAVFQMSAVRSCRLSPHARGLCLLWRWWATF